MEAASLVKVINTLHLFISISRGTPIPLRIPHHHRSHPPLRKLDRGYQLLSRNYIKKKLTVIPLHYRELSSSLLFLLFLFLILSTRTKLSFYALEVPFNDRISL
jgi:hypothetical protein